MNDYYSMLAVWLTKIDLMSNSDPYDYSNIDYLSNNVYYSLSELSW